MGMANAGKALPSISVNANRTSQARAPGRDLREAKMRPVMNKVYPDWQTVVVSDGFPGPEGVRATRPR